MSIRQMFMLVLGVACAGSVGCYGCMGDRCGYGGQVYDSCASCGVADASCGCPDASCGCPDATCGCPDPACGCPDASCGCPNDCAGGVGCGSPVRGRCPLLARLRNAICGCAGCGSDCYWSEWQCDPPCACDPCDQYGNFTRGSGGHYGGAYGRREYFSQQHQNLSEEFRVADQGEETTYR